MLTAKITLIVKLFIFVTIKKHKFREIMHNREEMMAAFGRFLDVLDELREKC